MGPRGPVTPAQEGPQAARGPPADQARECLTGPQRLPRVRRLTSAPELRRVFERGRRRRLEHLDVIWTDNSTGHPRLGLIVPKFQASAVARNRLRRRLREIWRCDLQADLPAWDTVLRARRDAYAASFGALRGQLLGWRAEAAG